MIRLLSIFTLLWIASATTAQNVCVIPQPLQVRESENTYTINSTTKIVTDAACKENSAYLKDLLSLNFQLKVTKKGANGIVLKQDKNLASELGTEGYKIQVSSKAVIIKAATQTGIFYGIQSLRQMLASNPTETGLGVIVPAVSITDYPRFSWRAYMLDEARHFQGAEFVKEILDEMAFLKMNVFHWHLTDDSGWRIEIKKYPKLTQVGAFRKTTQIGPKKWKSEIFSGEAHGGFYTKKQIKEIIEYAAKRHITIVPEIEMPGHASAAIAAYPWLGTIGELTEVPTTFGMFPDSYNFSNPRVYEFLEDVLSEVMDIFPGKVIHIGGDEVKFDTWRESTDMQNYMQKNGLTSPADLQIMFTNNISKFINKKHHRMMGWNEIVGANVHGSENDKDFVVKGELAKNTVVHFWKGSLDLVNNAVENGYDIVNSHHANTYLDYDYNSIPMEKAYNFDPIPEGLDKKYYAKVLGSGCQMWTEWTPTNKDVERQTFPRLAAYAEVGWTVKERKNYSSFRSNLNPILERWKKEGIKFSPIFEE